MNTDETPMGKRVHEKTTFSHQTAQLRTIYLHQRSIRAHLWLSQKPWIVPIPGTTNLQHLDEDLRAVAVKFTPEKLREFTAAADQIAIWATTTQRIAGDVGKRHPGTSAINQPVKLNIRKGRTDEKS
jgi:hypothetical protein